MADAVTSQTLFDGDKHVVMKFTNISDGSGESAVKKVDVSELNADIYGYLIIRNPLDDHRKKSPLFSKTEMNSSSSPPLQIPTISLKVNTRSLSAPRPF